MHEVLKLKGKGLHSTKLTERAWGQSLFAVFFLRDAEASKVLQISLCTLGISFTTMACFFFFCKGQPCVTLIYGNLAYQFISGLEWELEGVPSHVLSSALWIARLQFQSNSDCRVTFVLRYWLQQNKYSLVYFLYVMSNMPCWCHTPPNV